MRSAVAATAMNHQQARVSPPLRWLIMGAVGLVVAVGAYVWRYSGSPSAQTLGDLSELFAAVVAAVSCAGAAYKASEERRAWTMLALAATVWALGMAAYAWYGITRDHVYPFPSVADLGFIGYAVPAAVALFMFPQRRQNLSFWLRTGLDALVIALAILFVSWSTVLGPLYRAGGAVLTQITGLAYPIADVLILSLVLTLGMRRPAGQRMPWLLLGGGLVVLSVTDSIFVFLLSAGQTGLTGTPLVLGWMAAWFMVALAPWVPRSPAAAEVRRDVALAIELVPYVPVFFAALVSASVVLSDDRFLFTTGLILLFAVAWRQVMIVYENVTLTRDLEAKVAVRTAELAGLGAIVQASADAIVGRSADGVIRSWNPGAERLYGWSAEEIVGRHEEVLVPADRREEESAVLERVRWGEQVPRYDTERVRKDGSRVPVALTVSPIFHEDAVQAISAIGQDISERTAKDAALAAARNEALESSRLKSEFLATMSHEIRTPMNGVIGLTSLLLQTPLDETQRQYAEGVQGAGEALLAVINDILDFSKLEAGKVELELADFDPRGLVEEVASLFSLTAHGKRLELVAYCRPEVPALLVGDGGRIRQILLNLASNAVKFTATGEVAITVRSTPEDAGGVTIRFEVADTGIGISAAARTRLFESFSQADASTTRRYGGTGLGLAISRRLTEAMGGEIGVDSEVGVGSTFWFQATFPVAAQTQVAGQHLTPDLLEDVPVLVVDDNATNRLILQSQLTAWGMRPDVVEHPRSVVARMRDAVAAGHPYAIAVLDMCMPETDGLELARLISIDQTLNDTSLVMMTSTMQVDVAELKQAGVREWLTKPVRSSEFYDRLMRLMAPKAASAASAASLTGELAPRTVAAASLGRVLVVEDNALNQLVAEGVVSKLGYEVDIVANGAEALQAISTIYYSAVLMDCHMPVMDGFTATEEIRRGETNGDRVPIIAMTAAAMAEDRERCLAVGMDDYVSKPVNVTAIQDALTRWIRTQPAAAPMLTMGEQAQPNGDGSVIDMERQAVLRELGPDDGWGLLPAVVRAFSQDCPIILEAMRRAVETGDSPALGQSAHQLKGAASNIGAVSVAALCQQMEDASSTGAPLDSELLAQLEIELDRATRFLRDVLSAA